MYKLPSSPQSIKSPKPDLRIVTELLPTIEQPYPKIYPPPPLPRTDILSSMSSSPTKMSTTERDTKQAPFIGDKGFGGHHEKGLHLPMPGISGKPNGPVGNLLKGPVGADGNLKDAALMVGIKLDLEAEIHLTARVRGDVLVGLY